MKDFLRGEAIMEVIWGRFLWMEEVRLRWVREEDRVKREYVYTYVCTRGED